MTTWGVAGYEVTSQLLDDLNYLNMGELRSFCRRHGIPWTICVESPDGRLRRTGHGDRKAVVLDRVRWFLSTGEVAGPTVIPAAAVSDEPLPERPAPSDRLYFDCYDKQHRGLMAVLGELTDGRFRNGAIARLLCRDYWVRGEAPTLSTFAAAWMEADERGLGIERGDHPEAAYLTDRAAGTAGPDWKRKRAVIAARTLDALAQIP